MSVDDTSIIPYLLYQSVDLRFDFYDEIIVASTVLWITYSQDISTQEYLYLHCRQCRIIEVQVNGISADFVLNDPLKNLQPIPSSSAPYESIALDRAYRSALEISKLGELRIKLPKFSYSSEKNARNLTPKYRPVNRIPNGSPKDVLARFEALNGLLEHLRHQPSQDYLFTEPELNTDGTTAKEPQLPEKKQEKFLQIKISYVLEKRRGVPWSAGYVFRYQKQYADSFGGYYGYNDSQANINAASCVYSLNGAKLNQSLYNLDGIRCWLPCLDNLESRAVFDVTIHAPSDKTLVLCPGKRLSRIDRLIKRSHLQPNLSSDIDDGSDFFDGIGERNDHQTIPSLNANEILSYSSTRFFSMHRIPAAMVGFFIGDGESYNMPLYRCRGRFHVALNISDYSATDSTGKRDTIDIDDGRNLDSLRIVNRFDSENITNSNIFKASNDSRDSKRRRLSGQNVSVGTNGDNAMFLPESVHLLNARNVYEDRVRHSLLGFDMALKFIHKLLGRRYQHESFNQVYVPSLGDDYIALDGFALIDTKYLHTDEAPFLESPHHLIAIRAYLNSFLVPTIYVFGYLQEYLLIGAVGYVTHLYVQSVYGEEEAMCNLAKSIDTVVGLEKLNLAVAGDVRMNLPPIASISLPESYERFLPWFGSYFMNKSTVLFHVIENRVGGNEPIRRALQQVIRSPHCFKAEPSQSGTSSSMNAPVLLRNTSIASNTSDSPAIEFDGTREEKLSVSNNKPHDRGSEPTSVFQGVSLYASTTMQTFYNSPSGHASPGGHLSSPSYGFMSPNSGWYNDRSIGNSSPYYSPQSPGSAFDYYGILCSPQYSPDNYLQSASPELLRQSSFTIENTAPSLTHDENAISFPESLVSDFITGESFFEIVRSVTGVACDLQINILESLAYSNLTVRGKVDLVVDPKVDNKPRNMHFSFDPIINGSSHILSTSEITLKFRVWELREDRTTEPYLVLPLSGPGQQQSSTRGDILRHSQALFSKPGRQGGSQKKPMESELSTPSEPKPTTSQVEDQLKCLPEELSKNTSMSIIYRLYNHFQRCPQLFDLNYLNSSLSEGISSDNRPTALQRSRRRLFPIKAFLFDPFYSLLLHEINVAALPDSMLVEQLFVDVDIYDSLRQIQAIRGLGQSLSTVVRSYKTITGNQSSTDTMNKAEKNPSLQFHALVDCLLGVNPLPPSEMAKLGGQQYAQQYQTHSIFVRLEAAFELAKWQIDRTGNMSDDAQSSSLLQTSSSTKNAYCECFWVFLKALFDAFIVFNPENSSRPLSFHWDDSDESSNYIRYGLLLALSQLRIRGMSPIECIEFYLFICESSTRLTNQRSMESNGRHDHLKAVLLIACSRFQFERVYLENFIQRHYASDKTNTATEESAPLIVVDRLRDFAFTELKQSLLIAKTFSRLLHVPSGRNSMPETTFNGIVPVSALTCLGQLDRQGVQALRSVKRKVPSTVGLVSLIDYSQFFLPEGITLTLSRVGANPYSPADQGSSMKPIIPSFASPLNPPALRSAALEAFAGICLASYSTLVTSVRQQQIKNQAAQLTGSKPTQGASQEKQQIPENYFISAMIEAVLIVIRHDPDQSVRRQAATTLFHALHDMLPRVGETLLNLGHPRNCMGYSDVQGFTIIDPFKLMQRCRGLGSQLSSNANRGLLSANVGLKKELKKWWKLIAQFAANDQVIRSLLLMTWISVYRDNVPRSIASTVAGSGSPEPVRERNDDAVYQNMVNHLCPSLPEFPDPVENLARIDMKLKHGSTFTLTHARPQQTISHQQKLSIPSVASSSGIKHKENLPKAPSRATTAGQPASRPATDASNRSKPPQAAKSSDNVNHATTNLSSVDNTVSAPPTQAPNESQKLTVRISLKRSSSTADSTST